MTLFEAMLSIGFVAVVVMSNLMMMGFIFSSRKIAAQRHAFDENLEEILTRADSKRVCDTLFKNLGPQFQLSNLATERHITDLQEGPSTPILKVGRSDFNGTLVVTDMRLKLADTNGEQLKLGPYPGDQFPPMAYFWLDIDYEYHRDNPSEALALQHKGTRRLFFEVGVAQKVYIAPPGGGTSSGVGGGYYIDDSCVDYTAKYNQQALKLMCFLLRIRPDPDGTCDLTKSDGIRATACQLTGYGYGGRYCDRSIEIH